MTKTTATKRKDSDSVAKLLAHPIRVRILQILNERVASPSEIARETGERVNVISYHVQILRDGDCIELVERRPRRGAVEHFYRAMRIPFFTEEEWSGLPMPVRRTLLGQTLEDIFRHVSDAADNQGFDDPKMHVSWSPLTLDAQGWDEVAELLENVLARLPVLQAEASTRLSVLDDDARAAAEQRTEAVILHFHRAPKAASGTDG